jgi:hypothetical protein
MRAVKYRVRVFEVGHTYTQEVYECSEEPSADEPSADMETPEGAAMVAALAAVGSGRVKRAGTLHVLVSAIEGTWGYGVPVVLAISEAAKPLTAEELARVAAL